MKKRSVNRKKSFKSSWKSYQTSSNTGKKVKLGIFVLALLIIVILLGKLVSFVASFNSSYNPTSQEERVYLWNHKTNINLVVKLNSWSIWSFNPTQKTLTVIDIPDQLNTTTAFNYGTWPFSSVYSLGQSEKPAIGGKVLKKTSENLLGVPITGYWLLDDNLGSYTAEKFINSLRTSLPELVSTISQSKTDLTPNELFNLITGIRSTRFDKIRFINLTQSESTKWKVLADGSRTLEISTVNLDDLLTEVFYESKISEEGFSIAIFNTTKHPGLAEKAARLVTNIGGRVVLTSNTDQVLDSTAVIGKKSATSELLTASFSPVCLKKTGLLGFLKTNPCLKIQEAVKTTLADQLDRADITIFIGEDYFSSYSQR